MSQAAESKWIVKRSGDLEEVRSVCGFRKSVLTPEDGTKISISHLRIDDSKEHYHKTLEETYYVLRGSGFLLLDGEKVAISEGDAVTIRPGVRHHSEGDIEVLIICCPPYESSDVYFDD